MSDKIFYVTTPIYYVNASPHIGHAYTTVAADTLARYYRFKDGDAFFLTGSDEHGQKIERAAREADMSPQAFVDEIVGTFTSLWERMGLTNNDFIRTTDERHKQTVTHLLSTLEKKGDIYQGSYEGWYCTPCETFFPANQLDGQTVCPDCDRALEEIKETNYFFRLSKYQDWLRDYITEHETFIQPVTRRNEIMRFLDNDLQDLCISRPKERLSWGITLPFSPDHVTYVWFDALINYISALGYPENTALFESIWPCDVHLIGKDILRPHTVYWPIMLHAAGISLPRMVFAHGWWKCGDDKMSKSKGNIVDPIEVIAAYGVDSFRYFMLREISFGLDGTFSDAAFKRRFNTDLANDIGNLLNRTLTMANKYFDGTVPACEAPDEIDVLRVIAEALPAKVDEAMSRCQFSSALEAVWELVARANKFIEEKAPWTLAKEGKTRELASCVYGLIESLRIIALGVSPFIPLSAAKMWAQLGFENPLSDAGYAAFCAWGSLPAGHSIAKGEPIFPRLEI